MKEEEEEEEWGGGDHSIPWHQEQIWFSQRDLGWSDIQSQDILLSCWTYTISNLKEGHPETIKKWNRTRPLLHLSKHRQKTNKQKTWLLCYPQNTQT